MRSWLARLQRGRLGLRSRITLTFTLGAFMLSVLLAGSAYLLTRSALVRQRDQAAVDQAYIDARKVLANLESNPPGAQQALRDLGNTAAANPLVFYRGAWAARSAEYGPDSLPGVLSKRVGDDFVAARMTYSLKGRPVLAVGVPLTDVAASYYEITDLGDLHGTLRSVAVALVGAAAITTSLGVLLGSFAARRAVRPLAEAAQAAQALAGGRLDTRLEPTDDRDLGAVSNAFNDMAAALQQRVERDARFASDVSHELRSPLTTLSTSIEVMKARRDEMPERAQAALDLLVADVARFQNLVEDLLEISRFDAGAISLHREDLLVAEFVRQAVSVSSVRDAKVCVTPVAERLVINADKRRLARALANLIDNGRLHGGGEVEIGVMEASAEGEPVGHVRITVDDHGPGVPPEERSLVFERFARGGGAGRRGTTEGAGLGLAIVDEHIRLHGGRVWVEDRPDGLPGARFVIELPAEEV
jgi:two-component system, OmpR family, sensor histidine kinase MtrB